ncbi:MAG: hypothetical protein HYX37_01560 [Rhizobiales bacterium]|nr:hypothetical protein [Hyphomicrobiales bacterium]
MRTHLIATAIVSAMLFATSASATIVLNDDIGGKMEEYTARFQQTQDSGQTVIIDGTCLSACTMVLGLGPRAQHPSHARSAPSADVKRSAKTRAAPALRRDEELRPLQ